MANENNNIQATTDDSQIVLYQPDESVRLEVKLDATHETVWLTQQQIADLFGTKRPAITKHLSNIYASGELDKNSTCSILEHMGNDGKQRYATTYYKNKEYDNRYRNITPWQIGQRLWRAYESSQ